MKGNNKVKIDSGTGRNFMKNVRDGKKYMKGTTISYNKYCLNESVDSRKMDKD